VSKNINLRLTIPRGLEAKYMTFLDDEHYTEMAWLGGFGTAKSDCLVTSIIKTAYDYPGCTLVLARDELVNLKRTTLADLLNKAPELIAHHNKTESIVTFPEIPDHNGVPRASTVYCFGLMTGDYVQKLKSLQPFRIFIDEGDKILEEMFDMCVLRLRQKAYHRETGKLGKNQVKIVANDEGNNWLWRRMVGRPHPGKAMDPQWVKDNVGLREEFFLPKNPVQDVYDGDIVQWRDDRYIVKSVDSKGVFLEGHDGRVRVDQIKVVIQRFCIYAFSHENKSLNQQNLKNARGVSAAMRAKYILSQVDTQSGLMFPEFDVQTHVIPDQVVPYRWKTIVGLDHGFEHPTAAVAIALDAMNDVVVYKEYKAANLSVPDNAENIAEMMEGYEDVRFFGDTQLWSVDPRRPGEMMANDYIRAGVKPLIRANKNRELSIARIKEYLTVKPASLWQPEEKPRLYVMESCRDVVRTLLNMTWEQYRKKEDDDILDALRYAMMAVYNASRTAPVMGDELQSKPKPFSVRAY
jgi:hypothetical protein